MTTFTYLLTMRSPVAIELADKDGSLVHASVLKVVMEYSESTWLAAPPERGRMINVTVIAVAAAEGDSLAVLSKERGSGEPRPLGLNPQHIAAFQRIS